ncbi:MAG: metallophosphoesterase [Acidobacteria bacterium]|nr:metallophosphoesterase [Acidobacteriota bacterium]
MNAIGTASITRRDALRGLGAAAVGVAAGGTAYGYLVERHHIEVTRTPVAVSGLAGTLDGLKIGLLTDPHRSATVSHEDVAGAVSLLMAERPDLIVLGGDYVTWGDRAYVTPSADALAPLTAPHGVYAILGNHDDDRDMPAALIAKGFQVLKDARTRLMIRGEALELAGIRFWTRKVSEIARVVRGASATTVLLAHDPRRLNEAAALDIPLVLSGHTHGGQVVLPFVGAVAAKRFPVLWGTARRENTTMFVSRGVGTVYVPLRLNCPPEVAILSLQRQGQL